MITSRKLGCLASALVIAPAFQASAVVMAYEGFDYASSTAVEGANGGTGWGSGWVTVNNDAMDLTYAFQAQDINAPTSDAATGNQLYIDPGAANDDANGATPNIRRDLASTIDTDVAQTVYVSMLYRREDITSRDGAENSKQIRFNNANQQNVLAIGHSSTEDLEIVHFDSGGAVVTNTGAGDFELSTDYLLVGKLTFNAAGTPDVIEASLFETGDALTEPATYDLSVNAEVSDVLTQFQFGLARRAGRNFIDELKIGETFLDVTSPVSATLLGDYNNSGLVEQGDLDQVLANWGADFSTIPGTWVNQRPTEGIVDQAELDVVLTQWGSSSAPDFAGSGVPEPATAALIGLGGLALLRRRAA